MLPTATNERTTRRDWLTHKYRPDTTTNMKHPLGFDWLDVWKANHEAAHAVLAIVNGGEVKYIDIDFHGEEQDGSYAPTRHCMII